MEISSFLTKTLVFRIYALNQMTQLFKSRIYPWLWKNFQEHFPSSHIYLGTYEYWIACSWKSKQAHDCHNCTCRSYVHVRVVNWCQVASKTTHDVTPWTCSPGCLWPMMPHHGISSNSCLLLLQKQYGCLYGFLY